MNGKRMTGAILGGLAAGLGISALLIAGECKSGKPSELADLERAAAGRIGADAIAARDWVPAAGEQAVIQGGHLLLSAIAGAAYAASTDEDAGVVIPGVAFGLAFYAAMHWVTGPLLGVKKPEWRSDAGTMGMHALNHVAFGVATAAGAKAVTAL